jgi:tetratricopeptide (TPR) repeat protein
MRRHQGTRIGFCLILAAAVFAACQGKGPSPGGGAGFAEKQEIIKTYPFSDPDPVPIIARPSMGGQGARLYPYFFFEGFSGTGTDREWAVVRLENPFIALAVLPQVGGKVWGAAEKSNGRDFLYTNRVLKFRQIALRGPWTSGGVEFNFGIVGHAPSTATPVDYIVRKNGDGSVSCFVGAMDLPSRTRWSVEIRLPKDKAYFETNGSWFNPTPYSQSYYYWSCAAIKTAADLKYIFPGRFEIGHNYSVPLEPWPVDDQGRDLSWYKNNNFSGSKSYFTVGAYEDFYGAWYQDSDSGFGHWALYGDMPGRKVWIWDQSRAGEIWTDLLTDADGQYTEPQAGRLLNQSDHEFLRPGSSDRWREIWFPYRGIGPMADASPAGVLGVEAAAKTLTVGLYPLEPIADDLVVTSAGKEIHRERLDLPPAEPVKKTIPLALEGRPFQVMIGKTLVFNSDPKAGAIDRPLKFKSVDESTPEGLFLSGARYEKSRTFDLALEKYLACLAREPRHMRALARTAELYARRGEYEKGLSYAGWALEEDMYDPPANYVYGIIARRLGKIVDAKETLGWASRSLEFRSAANLRLAEIALTETRYDLAADYARRAIDVDTFNSPARETLAVALRESGKIEAARAVLDELLRIDPLDHLARFELHLLDPNDTTRNAFTAMIRNELPHETYIELAITYMRLGCDSDAAAVLKCAPAHPTAYYMLSRLLQNSSPEEGKAYFEKASSLSPLLVFPFREEEIPLYRWVQSLRPSDWKPKYYLGLIYWAKGRMDEAKELFRQSQGADFSPFFLSRAMLFRSSNPEIAKADYEHAVNIDGKSWRTWHALIDFDLKQGRHAEALDAARKAAGLFPGEIALKVDVVKALLLSARWAEAASVLDGLDVLPFEGAGEVHNLFVQTHLGLGIDKWQKRDWAGAVLAFERSKEFPEKLGTGKPFDPDQRLQDYLRGMCFERQGDARKRDAAFKEVVDYTLKYPESRGFGPYFGSLALRRAGQTGRASEIMRMASKPPDAILKILK